MFERAKLGLGLSLWSVAGFLAGAAPAATENVERLDGFVRTEAALSVAASREGRVIVGDPRGAWTLEGGGLAERLLSGSPVRAAVFARDGALWLASDAGLKRQDPVSRQLVPRGPAPGSARQVRDLLPAGGNGVFAATAGGLFYSDPETARPLGSSVPRGDTRALAWSRAGAWFAAIVDERVVRIDVVRGLEVSGAQWIALPPGAGNPLDLASAPEGVFILTDRALYHCDGDTARPVPQALPAGADPRRLASDADAVWLATSRGLYLATTTGWRIVGMAGSPVAAVAAADGMAWAAGPRGVWRISKERPLRSSEASELGPLAELRAKQAPPIARVRRAVVRAHGLDPAAGHRWRRRVAARGRLPEFELRLGYGGFADQSRQYDEAFTSGALRQLNDLDRDRGRDFDLVAVLRWDLGETLHHPEEVDVAREVREWIELRDEILDEVHQLYFERLRVLAETDALAPRDPARVRLSIRASELSAGLDAWTAGWWSQALRSAETDPSSLPAPVETRP